MLRLRPVAVAAAARRAAPAAVCMKENQRGQYATKRSTPASTCGTAKAAEEVHSESWIQQALKSRNKSHARDGRDLQRPRDGHRGPALQLAARRAERPHEARLRRRNTQQVRPDSDRCRSQVSIPSFRAQINSLNRGPQCRSQFRRHIVADQGGWIRRKGTCASKQKASPRVLTYTSRARQPPLSRSKIVQGSRRCECVRANQQDRAGLRSKSAYRLLTRMLGSARKGIEVRAAGLSSAHNNQGKELTAIKERDSQWGT